MATRNGPGQPHDQNLSRLERMLAEDREELAKSKGQIEAKAQNDFATTLEKLEAAPTFKLGEYLTQFLDQTLETFTQEPYKNDARYRLAYIKTARDTLNSHHPEQHGVFIALIQLEHLLDNRLIDRSDLRHTFDPEAIKTQWQNLLNTQIDQNSSHYQTIFLPKISAETREKAAEKRLDVFMRDSREHLREEVLLPFQDQMSEQVRRENMAHWFENLEESCQEYQADTENEDGKLSVLMTDCSNLQASLSRYALGMDNKLFGQDTARLVTAATSAFYPARQARKLVETTEDDIPLEELLEVFKILADLFQDRDLRNYAENAELDLSLGENDDRQADQARSQIAVLLEKARDLLPNQVDEIDAILERYNDKKNYDNKQIRDFIVHISEVLDDHARDKLIEVSTDSEAPAELVELCHNMQACLKFNQDMSTELDASNKSRIKTLVDNLNTATKDLRNASDPQANYRKSLQELFTKLEDPRLAPDERRALGLNLQAAIEDGDMGNRTKMRAFAEAYTKGEQTKSHKDALLQSTEDPDRNLLKRDRQDPADAQDQIDPGLEKYCDTLLWAIDHPHPPTSPEEFHQRFMDLFKKLRQTSFTDRQEAWPKAEQHRLADLLLARIDGRSVPGQKVRASIIDILKSGRLYSRLGQNFADTSEYDFQILNPRADKTVSIKKLEVVDLKETKAIVEWVYDGYDSYLSERTDESFTHFIENLTKKAQAVASAGIGSGIRRSAMKEIAVSICDKIDPESEQGARLIAWLNEAIAKCRPRSTPPTLNPEKGWDIFKPTQLAAKATGIPGKAAYALEAVNHQTETSAEKWLEPIKGWLLKDLNQVLSERDSNKNQEAVKVFLERVSQAKKLVQTAGFEGKSAITRWSDQQKEAFMTEIVDRISPSTELGQALRLIAASVVVEFTPGASNIAQRFLDGYTGELHNDICPADLFNHEQRESDDLQLQAIKPPQQLFEDPSRAINRAVQWVTRGADLYKAEEGDVNYPYMINIVCRKVLGLTSRAVDDVDFGQELFKIFSQKINKSHPFGPALLAYTAAAFAGESPIDPSQKLNRLLLERQAIPLGLFKSTRQIELDSTEPTHLEDYLLDGFQYFEIIDDPKETQSFVTDFLQKTTEVDAKLNQDERDQFWFNIRERLAPTPLGQLILLHLKKHKYAPRELLENLSQLRPDHCTPHIVDSPKQHKGPRFVPSIPVAQKSKLDPADPLAVSIPEHLYWDFTHIDKTKNWLFSELSLAMAAGKSAQAETKKHLKRLKAAVEQRDRFDNTPDWLQALTHYQQAAAAAPQRQVEAHRRHLRPALERFFSKLRVIYQFTVDTKRPYEDLQAIQKMVISSFRVKKSNQQALEEVVVQCLSAPKLEIDKLEGVIGTLSQKCQLNGYKFSVDSQEKCQIGANAQAHVGDLLELTFNTFEQDLSAENAIRKFFFAINRQFSQEKLKDAPRVAEELLKQAPAYFQPIYKSDLYTTLKAYTEGRWQQYQQRLDKLLEKAQRNDDLSEIHQSDFVFQFKKAEQEAGEQAGSAINLDDFMRNEGLPSGQTSPLVDRQADPPGGSVDFDFEFDLGGGDAFVDESPADTLPENPVPDSSSSFMVEAGGLPPIPPTGPAIIDSADRLRPELKPVDTFVRQAIPDVDSFRNAEEGTELQKYQDMLLKFLDNLAEIAKEMSAEREGGKRYERTDKEDVAKGIRGRMVFRPGKMLILRALVGAYIIDSTKLRTLVADLKAEINALQDKDIFWEIFASDPAEATTKMAAMQVPPKRVHTFDHAVDDVAATLDPSQQLSRQHINKILKIQENLQQAHDQARLYLTQVKSGKNVSKVGPFVVNFLQKLSTDTRFTDRNVYPQGQECLEAEYREAFACKVKADNPLASPFRAFIEAVFSDVDDQYENRVKAGAQALIDAAKPLKTRNIDEVFDFNAEPSLDAVLRAGGINIQSLTQAPQPEQAQHSVNLGRLGLGLAETAAPTPVDHIDGRPVPPVVVRPSRPVISEKELLDEALTGIESIIPRIPGQKTLETYRKMLLAFCDNLDQFIERHNVHAIKDNDLLGKLESAILSRFKTKQKAKEFELIERSILRTYIKASLSEYNPNTPTLEYARNALATINKPIEDHHFDLFLPADAYQARSNLSESDSDQRSFFKLGYRTGREVDAANVEQYSSVSALFHDFTGSIDFISFYANPTQANYMQLTVAICHKIDAQFRTQNFLKNPAFNADRMGYLEILNATLNQSQSRIYIHLKQFLANLASGLDSDSVWKELTNPANYTDDTCDWNVYELLISGERRQDERTRKALETTGDFTALKAQISESLRSVESEAMQALAKVHQLMPELVTADEGQAKILADFAAKLDEIERLMAPDSVEARRQIALQVMHWVDPRNPLYSAIARHVADVFGSEPTEAKRRFGEALKQQPFTSESLTKIFTDPEKRRQQFEQQIRRCLPIVSEYQGENEYMKMILDFHRNIAGFSRTYYLDNWPPMARMALAQQVCALLQFNSPEEASAISQPILARINGFDIESANQQLSTYLESLTEDQYNWNIFGPGEAVDDPFATPVQGGLEGDFDNVEAAREVVSVDQAITQLCEAVPEGAFPYDVLRTRVNTLVNSLRIAHPDKVTRVEAFIKAGQRVCRQQDLPEMHKATVLHLLKEVTDVQIVTPLFELILDTPLDQQATLNQSIKGRLILAKLGRMSSPFYELQPAERITEDELNHLSQFVFRDIWANGLAQNAVVRVIDNLDLIRDRLIQLPQSDMEKFKAKIGAKIHSPLAREIIFGLLPVGYLPGDTRQHPQFRKIANIIEEYAADIFNLSPEPKELTAVESKQRRLNLQWFTDDPALHNLRMLEAQSANIKPAERKAALEAFFHQLDTQIKNRSHLLSEGWPPGEGSSFLAEVQAHFNPFHPLYGELSQLITHPSRFKRWGGYNGAKKKFIKKMKNQPVSGLIDKIELTGEIKSRLVSALTQYQLSPNDPERELTLRAEFEDIAFRSDFSALKQIGFSDFFTELERDVCPIPDKETYLKLFHVPADEATPRWHEYFKARGVKF